MDIQFYVTSVYGRKRAYIKDDDKRSAFHRLTGNITMSDAQIEALKQFGCKLNEVANPNL